MCCTFSRLKGAHYRNKFRSLLDSVHVILHDKDLRFVKTNRSFELDLFGESIEPV